MDYQQRASNSMFAQSRSNLFGFGPFLARCSSSKYCEDRSAQQKDSWFYDKRHSAVPFVVDGKRDASK